MKSIAVFDIDGVVADFEGRLNFYLHTEFDRRATCNRSIYSLEERYADRPDVLKKALEFTADPNSYYPLFAETPMILFIKRIAEDGYSIYFVTSRPALAENVTRRWLHKYVNCGFQLYCGVSDKTKFLSAAEWSQDVEFAIDDSANIVKSLLAVGFNAICYDQPWNQGVFPRLYVRSDGELMLWENESVEAQSFWVEA